MKELFHNVFRDGRRLYTVSLDPGQSVYGEKIRGKYREWDPFRSKLAAAILKGMKTKPLKASSKVLYLGAAQGTTPSHVSDIADRGLVVCVEISQKAFEKLLPLCERRENMIPVLADANKPKEYAEYTTGIDVLYQDVAQPNQAAIFIRNFSFHGYGLLTIKARSIDVAARPKDIFKREISTIEGAGIKVLEVIPLEPFEKDHAMVVCKR